MNTAQRHEVLGRYEEEFKKRGIVPCRMSDDVRLPDRDTILAHCANMIPEMRTFLEGDEADLAKFNRWLGWMQGVLCAHGILTLAEERSHNRRPPR
jgi:hypothetical protein